jgi:hypothetical protein
MVRRRHQKSPTNNLAAWALLSAWKPPQTQRLTRRELEQKSLEELEALYLQARRQVHRHLGNQEWKNADRLKATINKIKTAIAAHQAP